MQRPPCLRAAPFKGGVALDHARAVNLPGRRAAPLSLKHLLPARPAQHKALLPMENAISDQQDAPHMCRRTSPVEGS